MYQWGNRGHPELKQLSKLKIEFLVQPREFNSRISTFNFKYERMFQVYMFSLR